MMQNDFLKVIIIDDEKLIRDLLRNCINWQNLGFEIIGESGNASEGLDLIADLVPDIIFTDICMPVMDGLEFAKQVIEKNPHIKIIILTGFEEFEFAKKGIKIGVTDFLLKPINDDEIKAALIKVKEQIIKEKIQAQEYTRLKIQLRQNMPFIKEKMLNEMIRNNNDMKEIDKRLAFYEIKIGDGDYQVAVIEVYEKNEYESIDEEKKLLLELRSLALVRDYFSTDENVHVFLDHCQRIVVFCNANILNISDCCEKINMIIKNKLKCHLSIGIGNCYETKSKIRMSYDEACLALKYKVIVGKNQIIHFPEVCLAQQEKTALDSDLMSKYCFYLKAGLKYKVDETVQIAFSEIKAFVNVKEKIRAIVCSFIVCILNVLIETAIRQDDIFDVHNQPFETVFKLDTLPEAQKYIMDTSLRVIQSINWMQGKKIIKIISEVKSYIDENFANPDLTLSEVAKKYFLNSSYLSRIFKQETNVTFIEYLNALRMNRAIKLLIETDKKAYQIAGEVGINDPHYFSVCFKKFTGVSINDYKKNK